MAKVKLRYIENVEGKQHLNFIEGRKLMQSARADLRNSIFSLLLFCALIFLFIIISGFNFFYIGFLVAFLVIFIAMIVVFSIQSRRGRKKCVKAVLNSKNTEIVNRASISKSSRAIVESMSSTLDKYEAKEKFPGIVKKVIRKGRHIHKANEITEFEEEKLKKESE